MLDVLVHFISIHSLFFDVGLLSIGLFAGKLREVGIFFRVTLILVKIAQWWFKTHPAGKRFAQETTHDEELQDIYNKHLKKYDTMTQNTNRLCLGRGGTMDSSPMG